ncbi:SEL1-like repeat protein [Pseudomonas sp. J452]|uniref:SEL1-like repeat protein n=1 Tax=Pseudomonas sp. J452 TaxID=2898441 RepID=UPI0021ADB6C8|nr:SEL1-like repeat protein [Pseudomonas sp. J452]UUY09653.1 SEL1-like repeat protein [Pseudomonas sp. J452]
MSHRMYLYNKAVVGSDEDDCLPLMEWGYELPLLLQPLFSAAPFVGANCYNSPGSEEGLYAEAKAGIQALRDFYDFIERHAGSLLDDVEAFHTARQKIFQLLDSRANHAWFHLDAWDVFNMADDERREQAEALLGEIEQANACIREAIACDNPLLLDNCPGVDAPWAGSFRAVLNLDNYDYGWEPLGSMLPSQDEDEPQIFCENQRYGLRDASGQVLIAPHYQAFFDFDWHSGLACVQHDQRFGYVDRQGREVIACQFEDAFDFVGEHALITEGGRYGLIDRQGRVTVPCQFDGGEALDYTGAYWSVQQGELWGAIDPSGRWMLPAQYQQIHAYEGYYSVKPAQGPQHLLTTRFHDLGAIGLDNINSVSLVEGGEAYLIRRREGKQWLWRALDEQGQALLPGEYQALDYLHDMQAWRVHDNRQYGLYRHQDERWLLPCTYARIELQQGCRSADGSHYCLVQEHKRWGLYRGGAQPGWTVEPRFERLANLHDGYFNACLEGRWGILDSQGQWLREPLDQAAAERRFVQSDELALVFHAEQAWLLQEDGSCQPLAAERALQIVDRYAQFGLSEVQQACLHNSAGDLWQALDSHRRGLAALEAQDYEKARPLLLRAVELGNHDALNDLGCLLDNADQNHAGALAYFQRASDAGSALAARNLGDCYRHGRGCETDLMQARHYLQLATERGHRAAHLELARLLFDQEPPVGDPDLALQHYLEAWRFGGRDESANQLGWLYEQREDYAQAQRYYQHAIGLGNSYAHWRMGRMHLYGLGCPTNLDKAREQLQLACEAGFEYAYLTLAELLLDDEHSQEEALAWLQKAVTAEVPEARELAEELLQQQKKPGLLSRLFGKQ